MHRPPSLVTILTMRLAGSIVFVGYCLSVVSSNATLTCLACPDNLVNCECQGSMELTWTVTSTATGSQLLTDPGIVFELGDKRGQPSSNNGFTGILCSITDFILYSKLTFNFSEDININITCQDNLRQIVTVSPQRASFPSSPVNLNYTPNTRSTFTVTVDLNWDFPMDDEGVANTSYLIFVNMSEVMNSTTNMATITLPFGVHLVQVAAVNDCGLSDNISRNINITDSNLLSSTTVAAEESSTDSTGDSVNTLSTSSTTSSTITTVVSGGSAIGIVAGVGGVFFIIAILIAGALVGALIWWRARKSGRHGGTKVNGDTEMMDGYAHFGFNTPNNGASGGSVVDPRIEDEYSVLARQNGPDRKTRGAQLVPQSEYSVVEQKNGAEPEMIQDYAYCRIGAEPKQPKKTVQYIEVETSTERVNRQKEMLAPARNDVQYSAVKVKTRPEDDLLNLNNLLLQLRPVQSSWAQIAKSLNITEDQIQHIRGTTSGEDYDCLVEVCDEWLESHRKQDMNPTWRAVSNALNRAGCKDLAKEIKGIYKTGKLPRSPSDDEVTAASASGDAPNSSYDDVIVTSPQKKPAMKPPAELPQYDDVTVTSPQKKPAMKPPAELPQYDDVITSSDAPPPIPPQRFEVQ